MRCPTGMTAVLTSEQVQLIKQLETIFMPHATKKRAALFDNGAKDHARFVHYTSAEAALSIITQKRIWMRNTTCMSDYLEVQHGFRLLNNYFKDEPKTNRFYAAFDVCSPGAGREAVTLFNQWWNDLQVNTYIASISEHDDREDTHGRLSMWRAFGTGNVARVALVLKVPNYAAGQAGLNVMFSPVAYLKEEEVHAELEGIIQNIADNCEFLRTVDRSFVVGTVFAMLVAGVVCLKHEGFHEEREWRVIYAPKRTPSPLMEAATKIVGGVPQIIYKLPLDAAVSDALSDLDLSRLFDRLIIGPSPYPGVMYEAFVDTLTKSGVANAQERVFISGIPIRA